MKRLPLIASIVMLLSASFGSLSNDKLTEFEQLVADHKGKVIYVDFWASWCVPCRKSFPWMNKMQTEHSNNNFTVLSVNLDAQPDLAEKFLKEVPAQFPIFYDPKGQVAKAFKLKGMPSSFIINKRGEIVSSHVGFTEKKKQKYQAEILALINKD
ncbi:TlpA disulfide reductase family protein [Thalassotalea sp. G2M2-11]|uniref:TlpA family protein disulfide reductase n=1 Tax=Thalassotalea sp. G2M2-11 TaxID=2787627 RepID=UPI00321716A8